MSGIAGIWNLDDRPVERPLLARLATTLNHRGPDDVGLWVDGAVGLACQHVRVAPETITERQPVVHGSGIALVFDGRIDNREELLSTLEPAPDIAADCPDPALALAVYRAYGEAFAERLTGDFAIALFDARRRQMVLVRDAVGIRPLYYCRAGRTFLFASEMKPLLAHAPIGLQPNEEMLASFVLGGLRQDDRGMTLFQNVCSVPPAHTTIVTPEKLITGRYWDFDLGRQVRLGSFVEYAEAFRHQLERAVRRRLRSAAPVAISVSGGLDSSSIFCTAEMLRRSVSEPAGSLSGVSCTYPAGSPADESEFVEQIERAYAVRIERVAMAPVQIGPLSGWNEATRSAEAPLLDPQCRETAALLQHVRQLGARVLVTGHWGDEILNDQGYLVDLLNTLQPHRLLTHLKESPRWMTEFPRDRVRRRFLERVVSYYGQFLPDVLLPVLRRLRAAPIRSRDPWYTDDLWEAAWRLPSRRKYVGRGRATAHARSLYQAVRSSNHVLRMEEDYKIAAMHGLEVAFPFLDRDLISFLMAVPGEMYARRGVPRALLRAAMRGVVPASILGRRRKATFWPFMNEGMERDLPQLIELLRPDALVVGHGYVKPDELRGQLERLKDRVPGTACNIPWSLQAVLRLECWLQLFFSNDSSSVRCAAAAESARE